MAVDKADVAKNRLISALNLGKPFLFNKIFMNNSYFVSRSYKAQTGCNIGPGIFRVVHLGKKIDAGADFYQIQCVFDIDKFAEWMGLVVKNGLHKKVYILAGLTPVRSARALHYIKNEVADLWPVNRCAPS